MRAMVSCGTMMQPSMTVGAALLAPIRNRTSKSLTFFVQDLGCGSEKRLRDANRMRRVGARYASSAATASASTLPEK